MSPRKHLTYANVTASVALFVALGGGAYAAATIKSGNVVDGSLTGVDVKNESIRSADVSGLRSTDFARGQLPAGKTGLTGPQGVQGLKGDQGIPGPIAGTPAGGALSGTYPSPGLASGAVGPSALAAGAVGPNALAALPGARATAATPSIPNNGTSTVNLATEAYDTGGMYTPGDDTISIPRTGTYLVMGTLHWNGAASTERQVYLFRTPGNETLQLTDSTVPGTLLTQEVQTLVRLNAGDAISLGAYQLTGSAVPTFDFSGAPPAASLLVQYISA
jgi:hypothetical protein